MILEKHIAYNFLAKDDLWMDIIEHTYPEEFKQLLENCDNDDFNPSDKISSLSWLVRPKNSMNYYVTETIIEKLELLKINKKNDRYDWTIFSGAKEGKYTFIFPNNNLLRFIIKKDMICFIHLEGAIRKVKGQMFWIMFYVNRETGDQCDHFEHIDVLGIEKFVYSLLCFFFLSENEEIIVKPKQRFGTKKSGKLINSLPFTITIVNNNWNITSIRTEGFGVRGHIAIRRTGKGRMGFKLVLIEPFQKNGYIKKATNNTDKQTSK